jgi:hypothetical protein
MRPLPATAILELWELGEPLERAERALAVLAGAGGEERLEALAELTLGERDARLLELRERTFGRTLQAFAKCPGCGEGYEFSLDTRELLARRRPGTPGEAELATGEFSLRFRLPNAGDLVAVANAPDVATARVQLAERCVSAASRGALAVEVSELPEHALVRLAQEMSELDPAAEIPVALTCAGCGRGWQPLFDIAEFFWVELRALARRLLREVHALASAYGWAESEILAMSARRRRAYLELAGA